MLPPAHRMRAPEDFRRARRGTKSSSRTVVVHLRVAADGSRPAPMVGFVVGKQVGTAVVRNLVKRRLRHVFRERLDLLPPGSAVVVRATPRAATATSAELAEDVDRALMRMRMDRS